VSVVIAGLLRDSQRGAASPSEVCMFRLGSVPPSDKHRAIQIPLDGGFDAI
jgi:hypothetical protein